MIYKKLRGGSTQPPKNLTGSQEPQKSFFKKIGNGITDSFRIFKKDFGYNFEIMIDKQRLRPKNSEVQRLFSSSIKAKKLLGWSPKYNELSGFKKGLEKTLNWFSNVENIKFYKSNIYNI